MSDFFVNARKADDTGNGLTLATAKKTLTAVNALTSNNDTVFMAPGEYDKPTSGFLFNDRFYIALQPGTVIITDSGVGSYTSVSSSLAWFSCDGLTFKGFADVIFDWTGGASTNQYLIFNRCRVTGMGAGGQIVKHHANTITQRYRFSTFDNNNPTLSFFGANILGKTTTDGVLGEFSNNLVYNNNTSTATMIVLQELGANLNGCFNNIFLNNTTVRIYNIVETDGDITTKIGGIDNNCYFGNTLSTGFAVTSTGEKATFANWTADTGQDFQAIVTDPQLVDAPQGIFQVTVGGNADDIGSDNLPIGAHGRGFAFTNNTFPTQWQNPVKTGPGTTALVGDNRELITGPDVTEEFPEIDLGAIHIVCRLTMEVREIFPADFINEDATTGKKTVLWRFGTTSPVGGSFVQQEIGTLFPVFQNMRFIQFKPKYNG